MATTEEKQELVEDIKRPVRQYRIILSGYGSQIYCDPSTKEEYDYWVTNKEQRCIDFNTEEHRSPFHDYMFNKEDEPNLYASVPENIRRDYDFYEYDAIEYVEGPDYFSANLTIEELEPTETHNGNVINTICNDVELADFVDDNNIETVVEESVVFEQKYVVSVVSNLKGMFFEGMIETNGKLDLSKLTFMMTETHNGETLVHSIKYNGEYVDNFGGDAIEKDIEISLINMKE
jgi:hypothetical protein